jgi:hypothetical protein
MHSLENELREIESNLRAEIKEIGIDGRAWRHWDVDDTYAFDELFESLEMYGFDIGYDECLKSQPFMNVAHIQAVYNYTVGTGTYPSRLQLHSRNRGLFNQKIDAKVVCTANARPVRASG